MLKKFGYVSLSLITAVVSALVIYKLSDEKLQPESVEFFAKDAVIAGKIEATEKFYATVPKVKSDEVDLTLCEKKSSIAE